MNWNLLEDLDWTDLGFLREPVLWITVIATALMVLADGLAGGLGWQSIVVAVVNAVLGLFARAQVTPPLAPKRMR